MRILLVGLMLLSTHLYAQSLSREELLESFKELSKSGFIPVEQQKLIESELTNMNDQKLQKLNELALPIAKAKSESLKEQGREPSSINPGEFLKDKDFINSAKLLEE